MNMLVLAKHGIGLVFCHSPMSKTLSSLNRCFAPVFLCPWMGGMSQGARDGGVTIPWMGGMSQGARDGGVTIPWKGGQIFAPRQQLLRCSTKLRPCSDAISAFPPSMAVICHKEEGWRCQDRNIFLSFQTDSIRTQIYI